MRLLAGDVHGFPEFFSLRMHRLDARSVPGQFPAILGCRVSRLLNQLSGQFQSDQRRHSVQPIRASTCPLLRFGEFLAQNASAGDAVRLFRQSESSPIEWWVCHQVLLQNQRNFDFLIIFGVFRIIASLFVSR